MATRVLPIVAIALPTAVALTGAGCAGHAERATSPDVPAQLVDLAPPATAAGAAPGPGATGTTAQAPPGSAASAPRPRPAVIDAAIARCEAAIDRAATLAADDAFATLTAGCADVFSRVSCRDALRDAANAPVERRAASLAKACADAYCPALTPPSPELCARRDPLPPPGELARMWPELHERILHEELGDERATALIERQQGLGRPRHLKGGFDCHVACCPPDQQGPAPDGTHECCLCDDDP